jgi:hypothetical protein
MMAKGYLTGSVGMAKWYTISAGYGHLTLCDVQEGVSFRNTLDG